MKLRKYRTMMEALQKLQRKGYTYGFKLKDKMLKCLESGKEYRPEDLRIAEYYRFEEDTNAAGMTVLFALYGNDGTKGTVVSNYGTFANMALISFLDRVKIMDRKDPGAAK